MTKRDNELTRFELIEKRARQLLDHFGMHRGQLPEPLITGLTGLRAAVDKPSDEDAATLKSERDTRLAAEALPTQPKPTAGN